MTFPRRLLSLAAGAALLASTALVAPGAQAADRPTITVAVQQIVNAGALDVLREQSNVGARVFYSIFEGLIDFERQTDDLPQKPGLATSWKRIDDRTVELTLREGVKFHDGSDFNAEAVKFNFDRMLNEDNEYYDTGPFPLAFFFSSIAVADASWMMSAQLSVGCASVNSRWLAVATYSSGAGTSRALRSAERRRPLC